MSPAFIAGEHQVVSCTKIIAKIFVETNMEPLTLKGIMTQIETVRLLGISGNSIQIIQNIFSSAEKVLMAKK